MACCSSADGSAPAFFSASSAGPWTAADRLPALADIPGSGQVVRGGGPVLTVFARGDTGPASVAELRSRVEAVKTVTG
jgi:hypothetical protein